MFTKSISPVNRLLLVPPSVNAPPGSRVCAFASPLKRVRKNDISGVENELPFANACQKGVALLWAIVEKAKPIKPEMGACKKFAEVSVTKVSTWF